jgi:transposase
MVAKKGGQKRFWSEEQKRSICAQTRIPGVSVAQVARRDAMNANLIHKWLRDPRFAPNEATPETQGAAFLPVEIAGIAPLCDCRNCPRHRLFPAPQRIDITLSDGRRILVAGRMTLSSALSVVEGLMP